MIFRFNAIALVATVAAGMLAGCGGSGALQAGPQDAQGTAPLGGVLRAQTEAMTGATTDRRVVYVGNIDGKPGLGNVIVFPASLKDLNPNPSRMIQNGTVRPWGIATDAQGNLYVANLPQGAPSIGITVFHPGASSPFRTITDSIYYPTDVSVAKDGTVYVNQRMDANGLASVVTVYPPGKNKASHIINLNFSGYDPTSDQMAFDTQGNLLVEDTAFVHGGQITMVISRINTKTFKWSRVDLNLAGLDGPGLAVDGAGDIYVSGQYTGQIAIFAPGSKNPTRMIARGAAEMTIMPDGALYAASGDGVDEYAPGGSSPVNTIHAQAQGVGVAVGPAR